MPRQPNREPGQKKSRQHLRRLSNIVRTTCALTATLLFLLLPAPAESDSVQDYRLDAESLAVAFAAYADSIAELHQFLTACTAADGSNWDQSVGLLSATMQRAGLEQSEIEAVGKRLTAGATATYDCASEGAKARLQQEAPKDWVEFHKDSLANLGVEIAMPVPQTDTRLAAIRAIFARHIPDQARMLNCTALVTARWLPAAYHDWEGLVHQAGDAMTAAGFDEETVASVIDPARARNLMRPVADRQAAIADCLADDGWMRRYADFSSFALGGEVNEALAAKP